MSREIRKMIDKVKNFKQFNESTNTIDSVHVATHIFELLSDEQKGDWSFDDYHKVIKKFGDSWRLERINPKTLKFNEDFDKESVQYYLNLLKNDTELTPIVIDNKNEIIDGNHRAKASLIYDKDILAYSPISNKSSDKTKPPNEYYEKIEPRRFVFHNSHKKNRESILKNGIQVNIGDSYKDNWSEFQPIKPAIFAVNTPNYIEYIGLKYSNDYDIWRIDTTKCNNNWYKDFNMGGDNIMTFDNIPNNCITLFRKSGKWKL